MDVKEESTGARTSLEFYCFGPERWWENDAISYMYVRACSVMSDCCDPWTVARQAPLSMELPRQEYWSGLTFHSSGDLSDPGIELKSPAWQVNSLPLNHLGSPLDIILLHNFILLRAR